MVFKNGCLHIIVAQLQMSGLSSFSMIQVAGLDAKNVQ